MEACRRHGLAVLRRVSGGGAVLQTQGVLNYSLLFPDHGRLRMAGGFACGTALIRRALQRLSVVTMVRGVSDVTVGERKISGNAIARRGRIFLVHGTLLVDLDLDLLDACLKHPGREPDYRQGRRHRDFLITLAAMGEFKRHVVAEALETAGWELGNILLFNGR